MGFPSIQSVSSNFKDKETQRKVNNVVSQYVDKFQKIVTESKLPVGEFSFGKPTNYYIGLDKKYIHLIYSSDYAGGIAEVVFFDLREQPLETYPLEEVVRFFRSQKGFVNWSGVLIDSKLINSDIIVDKLENIAREQFKREYKSILIKHQPLFISEEQLKKFLKCASEEEFTQFLLVPLLRHLGFASTEAKGHRDKSLEFGQDIQRMKIQLPTGHWLYFSAQVKKGDINSNSQVQKNHIEKVLIQTHSQLEWEMPDPEMGINVKPDHILLIVSGDITESAKKYIFDHSLVKKKKVLLWEKDKIIELCRIKGLPEQVQKAILEINEKKFYAK